MLVKKEMSKIAKTSLAQEIIDLLTQLRSRLSAPISTPFLVSIGAKSSKSLMDFYGVLFERTAQLNCVFLSTLNVLGMKLFQQQYRKKKKKQKRTQVEVSAQLKEFQKRLGRKVENSWINESDGNGAYYATHM